MKPKIAFESEHIIVDWNNTPINHIPEWPFGIFWNIQTSSKIIEILEKKYPEIKEWWWVSKELDASQIEIRNTEAKETLEEAQDELCMLYERIEDIVKNELWLQLLDWAVPKQDFEPVTSWTIREYVLSGGPFVADLVRRELLIKKRYKNVDDKLRSISLNTRKATNIAWIHFHIDAEKNSGFQTHQIISKTIKDIYQKDKSKLLLSEERDEMMKKVVSWLIKSGFLQKDSILSELEPINFLNNWEYPIDKKFIKKILLEKDWKPKFSYNYVTLKKPWWYTTEIRTPDWVWTLNWLIDSTTKIYELIVKDILEQ